MRRQIRSVEDQKAYEGSLKIHRLSHRWPRHEQINGIADQIRRSSKSICANLAEGFGKQSHSKAEFKRYLSMAIGSADETKLWLQYAKDLGYLEAAEAEKLRQGYQIIAKMLSGLHQHWR